MRVLITGSRDWRDERAIAEALADIDTKHPAGPITLVHGDAAGADSIAAYWAHEYGWVLEGHPANWAQLGNRAGPLRNEHMVQLGADMCLAFFKTGAGNRGTTHCSAEAEAAGIPVRRYYG